MSEKWILIADDEEPVLSVFMSSLKRLGPEYKVITVTSAFEAIEQLKKRNFDLVVSDYKMAGMDGLILLQTVRKVQPNAHTIMMTAYGSPNLEEDLQQLNARYISKPVDIDKFRQVVLESLGEKPNNAQMIKIISEEEYSEINQILKQLCSDISARCILLTDLDGHLITRTGVTDLLPLEAVASLLGGGMASLFEAGRVMDGNPESINLAYREGVHEALYMTNVGRKFLLIMVVDRGMFSTRIGSVLYFARQAAITLKNKFNQSSQVPSQQIFSSDLEQELGDEFDKLFSTETQNVKKGTAGLSLDTNK
jgi:CheY-like chemotaxis protein